MFIYLCFVTSPFLLYFTHFYCILPIFHYIFPLFLPYFYPIFTLFLPFFRYTFHLSFSVVSFPLKSVLFYPKDLSFFTVFFPLKIRILYPRKASKRGGAVEACWAHNPEVGGSKPLSAKVFYRIFPLKDRAKETVNTAFSLLIFCDFVVSYKVTVICVSVLLARWM